MIQQHQAASSLHSFPSFRLLHHVSRRRQRLCSLIAIALVLLVAAIVTYSGLATRIDAISTTSIPHPLHQIPRANNSANRVSGTDRHQAQNPPSHQMANISDKWHNSTRNFAVNVSHNIPPNIWQILLPKKPSASVDTFVDNPEAVMNTASWVTMNPDYKYTLLGQKGCDEFIQTHFVSDAKIVDAYNKMSNVGMKSDFLRYLLLGAKGGVYSDIDTIALKPIDEWVPANIRDKVAMVVGIEYDKLDSIGWVDIVHWVQFCQWTIAAAPGHPVFRKMVARVLESLDDLSAQHGVPLEELELASFEIMNSTGPAAWTDVIFEQLREYDPSLTDPKDLSSLTGPRLYGDILVLGIDGFGMGQPHSNSTNDGTIPDAALARHLFRGTWREE